MIKYAWNTNELKKLKQKFIEELYNGNLTSQREYEVQTNIQTISSMLKQNKFKNPILTFMNNDILKFNPKFNIQEFKEAKETFSTEFQMDIVFNHNSLLKKYNDVLLNFQNVSCKIPFEHQIELTKENYLSIYGLEKDFDFVFNPDNNRICLTKNANNNFTYTIDELVYLIIYFSNNVKTYFDLNHETGHLHEHYISDKIVYINNPRLYSYSEISSLLLELVSANKLLKEKIITEDDFKNIQLDIMTTNLKVYDLMRALYISSKQKPNLLDKFQMCMYEDVFNDLHYHFSYLIALNLYYQFLQSPKDAIYNLKYILINIKEDNEKQILKDAQIDLSGSCLEKHIKKQMRNN